MCQVPSACFVSLKRTSSPTLRSDSAIVAPAFLSDYRELQLGLWLLSYLLGVLCFRHASREIGYAAAIGAAGVIVALPLLSTTFDGGRSIGTEYLEFLRDRWPYLTAGIVAFLAGALDFRRFRLAAAWEPRLAGFVMALSVGLGAVFVLNWEDRRREDRESTRLNSSHVSESRMPSSA